MGNNNKNKNRRRFLMQILKRAHRNSHNLKHNKNESLMILRRLNQIAILRYY